MALRAPLAWGVAPRRNGRDLWGYAPACDYPKDRMLALQRQAKAASAAAPVDTGLALEKIRFRYAVSGSNPPWKPLRAFDDGEKVYIQSPPGIAQGELPIPPAVLHRGSAVRRGGTDHEPGRHSRPRHATGGQGGARGGCLSVAVLGALMWSLQPQRRGPASTAVQPADPTAVQNRQDQKEAFQKAGATETRNSGNLTLPASPYQVMAGTVVAGPAGSHHRQPRSGAAAVPAAFLQQGDSR